MTKQISAFSDSRSECSRRAFLRVLPPKVHTIAVVTGGLRRLYSLLKEPNQSAKHGEGVFTDSKGKFQPPDGTLLASRYRVADIISCQGQSAILIRAHDILRGDMTVVIKALHKRDNYFEIGFQEAHTLHRLACADPSGFSHTVRLLNTFLYDGHFCLVFEALDPRPVTHVISSLHLAHEQLLRALRKLTLQLLQVVGFLRLNNTIHADLKPENILLQNVRDLSSLRVIDFGNAINHVHREMSLYYQDFEVQTLLYRSPEVLFGIPFGAEIDMWSLGCVLAEIYLGQPLIHGTSKRAIIQSMVDVLGPLPHQMFCRGKFFDQLEQFTQKDISGQHVTVRLVKQFQQRFQPDYTFTSLLAGMLTYDPDRRLTPLQAAQHPFLAPEVCLPYLMLSSGVKESLPPTVFVSADDYTLSPNIASDIRRQHPSSLDLLRLGTGQSADDSAETTFASSPSRPIHGASLGPSPTECTARSSRGKCSSGPSPGEYTARSARLSGSRCSDAITPLSCRSPDTTFHIRQGSGLGGESPSCPEMPLPTDSDGTADNSQRLSNRQVGFSQRKPAATSQTPIRQASVRTRISASHQDRSDQHGEHDAGNDDRRSSVLKVGSAGSLAACDAQQLSALWRQSCDVWPRGDNAGCLDQITQQNPVGCSSQCHSNSAVHKGRQSDASVHPCSLQVSELTARQAEPLTCESENEAVSRECECSSQLATAGSCSSSRDLSDINFTAKALNETFAVVEVESAEAPTECETHPPFLAMCVPSHVIKHAPSLAIQTVSWGQEEESPATSWEKHRERGLSPETSHEASTKSAGNWSKHKHQHTDVMHQPSLPSASTGHSARLSGSSSDQGKALPAICASPGTEEESVRTDLSETSQNKTDCTDVCRGISCRSSKRGGSVEPVMSSSKKRCRMERLVPASSDTLHFKQSQSVTLTVTAEDWAVGCDDSGRCGDTLHHQSWTESSSCPVTQPAERERCAHLGKAGVMVQDTQDAVHHQHALSWLSPGEETEQRHSSMVAEGVTCDFESDCSDDSDRSGLRELISTLARETPCASRRSSKDERNASSTVLLEDALHVKSGNTCSYDVEKDASCSSTKAEKDASSSGIKAEDQISHHMHTRVRRSQKTSRDLCGSHHCCASSNQRISPRKVKWGSTDTQSSKHERYVMVQHLQYLSPSLDKSTSRRTIKQAAPRVLVTSSITTGKETVHVETVPSLSVTSASKQADGMKCGQLASAGQKHPQRSDGAGKQLASSSLSARKRLNFHGQSPKRGTPAKNPRGKGTTVESGADGSVQGKVRREINPVMRDRAAFVKGQLELLPSPVKKQRNLVSPRQRDLSSEDQQRTICKHLRKNGTSHQRLGSSPKICSSSQDVKVHSSQYVHSSQMVRPSSKKICVSSSKTCASSQAFQSFHSSSRKRGRSVSASCKAQTQRSSCSQNEDMREVVGPSEFGHGEDSRDSLNTQAAGKGYHDNIVLPGHGDGDTSDDDFVILL